MTVASSSNCPTPPRGTLPHDLELVAVRVAAVERLADAVIGGAGQRTELASGDFAISASASIVSISQARW